MLPYFGVLLFLQLLPVLWPERVDTCEPTVMHVTTGIFASTYTVATLSYFFARGGIDLTLVTGLSAQESVDLCRRVLLAMIIACASYLAGYYQPSLGLRIARLFPKVGGLDWEPPRLHGASAAVLLLAATAYAVFQIRAGVPLLDATQLDEGKSVWRDDPTLSWMLRGVQLMFVPVFLYLAAALAGGKRVQIMLLGVALAFAAFLNLRIGQRGVPFYALLGAVVIFHYLRRRVPVWLVVGILVASIAASNLLLSWRASFAVKNVSGEVESTGVLQDALLALGDNEAERQRFSATAVLFHEWPEYRDYLLGQTWLPMFVALVPRWLWPEKGNYFQWSDSRIVFNLTGSPIPSALPPVLYINFSWLGLVIGMFLWGGIMRGLYLWLQQAPNDRNLVVLYAMFLLYFGVTPFGFAFTLQYVIPTWLMLRIIGTRRQAASATDVIYDSAESRASESRRAS